MGQRAHLLSEMETVREVRDEAATFVTTTERQQRRLQVVELFSTGDKPNEICPLCANPIRSNARNAYDRARCISRAAEPAPVCGTGKTCSISCTSLPFRPA